MQDDPLNFKLKNVDLAVINRLYPELLPQALKELVEQSKVQGNNECFIDINIPSAIVINHPAIEDFNQLYTGFESIKSNVDNNLLHQAQLQYQSKVEELANVITRDIRSKFEKAININSITNAKLSPHVDTLFCICLIFYNRHWDPYGLTFNGPVAEHPISDLLPHRQPYTYRAVKQVKFLSDLLYHYFKMPNFKKEIVVSIGSPKHITDDIDWIINAISNNIPLSTDYLGVALNKLLKHRENMEHKAFINELRKFTKLKEYDFVNEKRKVVRNYCIDIHKIFSHYLGLPTTNLTGKRTKLYHNVLLAFEMDDFRVMHRDHEYSKSRADNAENRLGVLIRPKLYK